MDNKYGLGGAKVAHEHHDAKVKSTKPAALCRFCGSAHLTFSPTMDDHQCDECDKWQVDVPMGYSTGRSADY